MRYRVLITETNIDDDAHPEAFRYAIEADSEDEAAVEGRDRFIEQTGREPAARALIDVESLE
jgi:hypothetical protein